MSSRLAECLVEQGGKAQAGERETPIHCSDISAIVGFVYGSGTLVENPASFGVRFVDPVGGCASGLLIQVFGSDELFQHFHVLAVAQVSMPDQRVVPGSVQVARVRAALPGAENRQLNIVSAVMFGYGVQRLMRVGHQMHHPLERSEPVFTRPAAIAQHLGKHLDPVYDAIMAVNAGVPVAPLRMKAVARLRKSRSALRDIYEMPTVALGKFSFDMVGPIGNRSQVFVAQKLFQFRSGGRRQARFGNFGNESVSFAAPGKKRAGQQH